MEPSPTTPASAALLQATIRSAAPSIPQTDNVGVSGDTRDLYYVLDYLTFAVDRAYPEIPCANGCSHCCENQVFRVTESEWRVAKRGLEAFSPAARAAAFARAHELFDATRGQLEQMAALWSRGELVSPDLHASTPKSCPLLANGRCSIYDERPAICRGYGYFSATINGNASLLICQQWGPGWVKHLEDTGIDQLPMPNWNPVQRQLETLNQGAAIKPLPLWILEWADELNSVQETLGQP